MERIGKVRLGVKREVILSCILVISVLVQMFLMVVFHAKLVSAATLSRSDNAKQALIEKNYGKFPLYFIENRGQFDTRVTYYVKGRDKTLFFTPQGLTLILAGNGKISTSQEAVVHRASYSTGLAKSNPADSLKQWVIKLDFVGANPDVKPEGLELTNAVFSYFKGKRDEWKAGLKTYAKVVYRDLWPGIDLIYTGTVNRLKYTFVVRPGADPNMIRLAYRGTTSVVVNDGGQLEIKTPLGGFHDDCPYTYQEVNGQRVEIITAYVLESDENASENVYGFKLGPYDKSKPVILDPAVLVYCGYIGGSSDEIGWAISLDGDGNAYITGRTESSQATFPVTVGPYLIKKLGNDVFVAKINSYGTGLIYCGYIGGGDEDVGNSIAVDNEGNAYVIGYTRSDETTFPVLVGPRLIYRGGDDAFIAKVKSSGTALDYCGYIGGTDYDVGYGIAVDGDGNAYMTGLTRSDDFPVFLGLDTTHNGYDDCFVTKVQADGSAFVYSGYIGGQYPEHGRDIAVDGDGNAYVIGLTRSTEATFPVTVGPDLTHNGGDDVFVVRVNASGTAPLDYCGYIGGDEDETGTGITVDGEGNVYITGYTKSTEGTFPVLVGPDLTHNGSNDAFVAKVKANPNDPDPLNNFHYCGYIGGIDNREYGGDIAIDNLGNAYVTGYTGSDETTFPVVVGPDLTYNGGDYDAFVARVNSSGSALDYCGYIGGDEEDTCNGIAVDGLGNAYVAGSTQSYQATFPVVVGPDLMHNGGWDVFVAKISSVQVGAELAVDFGGDGFWDFDGADWIYLALWNPDGNMLEWNDGLAVDFASYGLWNYDGTSWSSLAGWNPGGMKVYGTGLAVDFDTYGLWYYNGSTWSSLASWNPEGMETWGSNLAVDFGTYGLWNYDGSSWTSLAVWNPFNMLAYNAGLAVDFDTYGLWYYNGSSWSSLAGWNPEGMKTWATGLAVDFGASGLWNYNGSSWTSLAVWDPDVMEAYDTGIAVDFDIYGVWYYDGSSWISLAGWNAEDMEAWASGLAVDFGASYGLWNYDGSSWTSLAGWDPEDMIDVDLN